ncbi:MAG: Flp pilus assembly protein CpaB [Firmicutes bacterium]|jgi:pilus assembly protein CpaB|nr:Flp pilus assembly protein CpaB [Bacillota bacterium]HOB21504.1 Flp pilus assembly protein CpaB [Bacillota bacterium]HQD40645.1 Flp pilus assembly protein CpaB [Bacillota bacterium]
MFSFDRKYLLAAVICGVAAAVTLYFYLQQLERKVLASARYTEIVVAKRDLPLRTLLKKDDLRLVKIPRSAKEEGDLTCLEDAVGMVLAAELAEGQRLKKDHLLQENQLASFSHKIPPLWRAVTISTDEVNSLSGMLLPGDRVDLILFQREEQKSQVLISDREVLAVGRQLGLENGEKEQILSITLLVKREEAAKIAAAEETGRIRIVLRPLRGEEPPLPAVKPPKPKVASQKASQPQKKVPVRQSQKNIPEPEPEVEVRKPILLIQGSKFQEIWPN